MKQILLALAILVATFTSSAQTTITIGANNGTTGLTASSPVAQYYRSNHCQIVYTKAEINAAGMTSCGTLTKIAFNVVNPNINPILNWTVKVRHTTATDAGAHDGATDFVTVYNIASWTPTTGFNTINLSVPFGWDGSRNLCFDICNDITNPGFTQSGTVVYYTQTNGYRYTWSDVTAQCGLTTGTILTTKPQIRMEFLSAAAPVAAFFAPPTSICQNSPLTLINNSTNLVGSTIQWTISPSTVTYIGGTNSASKNPSIKFGATGTYTIKMRVGNCVGADSVTKTISVVAPSSAPVADFFSPVRDIPRLSPPITYSDLSTNCPQTYRWYSPDYANTYGYNPFLDSTVQNGQAFFAFSGTFTICLQVTNSAGTHTTCKTAYIRVKDAVQYCTDSISVSSEGFVTDEGGPGNGYTNNKTLCMTSPSCPSGTCKGIVIDPCASSISLTFTQIKLGGGADSIFVLNGNTPTSPRLLALGASSNGTNPTVTASSGKMFIYMVSDGSGIDSGFTARWTSVGGNYNKPDAGFDIVQQKGMPMDTFYSGYPLRLMNTTTGTDAKYTWDVNGDNFNDSTSANPSTMLYNFTASPEVYYIRLLAYNCKGIDTFYKAVTIVPVTGKPINVDFVADKVTVSTQDTITLTDLSFGSTAWEWSFIPAANVAFIPGYNKNSINPKIKLVGASCVRVAMKVSNAAGADSAIKSCYLKIRNYCQPGISGSATADAGISKVSMGSINNASPAGVDSYTNFYDSSFGATSVYLGLSYNITVERPSNVDKVNVKAWVDMNLDGDFDDAGEEVLTANNVSGTSVSQSFTIPMNSVFGVSTILRVGMSAASSFLYPCAAQVGEFEDYKINIAKDLIKPVININGSDTIYIEQFTSYNDPGATASDNLEGDLTSKIIRTSTVDTSITGYFRVCYDVQDAYGNWADTKCRTVVIVVDRTAPVITILGKNPDTVAVKSGPYTDPGATAFDNYSGNLTTKITSTSNVNTDSIGIYTITYKVTDFFGFTDQKVRIVVVGDKVKPVLTRVTGTANHIHPVHTPLVDKNVVNDSDNYWKNMVPVRTGNVNVDKLGVYPVCYNVTDGSGNAATALCFSIEVRDTYAPVIHLAGADTLTLDVFTSHTENLPAASDNYDLFVTVADSGSFNRNITGSYVIKYSSVDSSGNTAVKYRVIHIVDREKPVIKLKGNAIMSWSLGKPWVDPGAQLIDNYCTEISMTPLLVVTGTPDVYTPDVYTLTYTVKDCSGNTSDPVQRQVLITITGVEDVAANAEIIAYPNPARDVVNLLLTDKAGKEVTIILTDMLGNELLRNKTRVSSDVISISTSALRSGMYMLSVESEDGRASKKINVIK